MSKNTRRKDKIIFAIDNIGSGANIVDKEFKTGKRYLIQAVGGQNIEIGFNINTSLAENTVKLDAIDFEIIDVINSIAKNKIARNEDATFTIYELLQWLYNNKRQNYTDKSKEIIKRVNTLSLLKIYVNYKPLATKFKTKIQEKDLIVEDYILNISRVNNKYIINNMPLKLFTENTNKIVSITRGAYYQTKTRFTNDSRAVRQYLVRKFNMRLVTSLTIEKIINDTHIKKDKNKRHLELIEKHLTELYEQGAIIGFTDFCYYDNADNIVSDIKDAYKVVRLKNKKG